MEAKVVLYGLPESGKSSFISVICSGEFPSDYYSTEAQKQTKTTMTVNGNEVSVIFFDVGGDTFIDSVTTVGTYADNGPIHVFMMPDEESFGFVSNYLSQSYYENATKAVIAIICNKTDVNNEKMIEKANAIECADKDKIVVYEVALTDVEATKNVMSEILTQYFKTEGLIQTDEKPSKKGKDQKPGKEAKPAKDQKSGKKAKSGKGCFIL